MKTTDKKKAFIEGLKTVSEKRSDERQLGELQRRAAPDASQNLAKGSLDKDALTVKGDMKSADVSNNMKQATMSGDDHVKKIADIRMKNKLRSSFKAAAESGDKSMMDQLRKVAGNLKKGASGGLKAIPVVGALGALMGADDASAAIPGLDTADSAGMSAGAENQMLAEYDATKDYNNSQAKKDRLAALAKLAKSRKE